MAYDQSYHLQFTAANKWRWLLQVRPAHPSVSSYSNVDLPPDSFEVLGYGRAHPNKPVGMCDAMTIELRVDLTALVGGDFDYLRGLIQDSCLISGGQIYFNTFALFTDMGNSTLTVDEFSVAAVCAQKPTVEQEYDWDGASMMTITAVDVMKLSMETTSIVEDFTEQGAPFEVGAFDIAFVLYDLMLGTVDRRISNSAGVLWGFGYGMRSMEGAWKSVGRLLSHKAYTAYRRAIPYWPDHATWIDARPTMPWEHWTFYRQDYSTDINGKVALALDDVFYIRYNEFAGLDRKNTGYFLGNRFDNWWNAHESIAEQALAKSRTTWDGTPIVVRPVVEFAPPWAGYDATTPYALTLDDMFDPTMPLVGHEVLKEARVKVNPKNKQEAKVSEEDITEFKHGTTLTIVDDEWGVEELQYENLPEVRIHDSIGFHHSDIIEGVVYDLPYPVNKRIWFSTLYAYVSDRVYCRLHHHVKIWDGVEDHEAPDLTGVEWHISQLVTDQLVNLFRIQSEHGGIAGTLARAYYGAFGRRNQTKFSTSTEVVEQLMPHHVGDIITVDPGTATNDDLGGLFDEATVMMGSWLDFETCSLKLDIFIRGSKDTL